MIRSKYISPYNNPPRVLDEVSLTIPDQALSVRQILERYAVGASIDASEHPGSFDNDVDFDDFAPTESPDFDLADIQQEREFLDALRAAHGDETPDSLEKDNPLLEPSEKDPPKEAPSGREKPAT